LRKIIATIAALLLLASLSWGVSSLARPYENADRLMDAHHKTQRMLEEMMEILKRK